MAFVTVEDLYGSAELVVFDSVYSRSSNLLLEDNVVLVEGRISIREDAPVKIVASKISEFNIISFSFLFFLFNLKFLTFFLKIK